MHRAMMYICTGCAAVWFTLGVVSGLTECYATALAFGALGYLNARFIP